MQHQSGFALTFRRFRSLQVKTLTALWLAPILVSAVDLKNEDGKTYQVKVHEGASTTHTSISGGSTRVNLTKEGTVEIIGAGTFRASGLKRVVIREGRLIFE